MDVLIRLFTRRRIVVRKRHRPAIYGVLYAGNLLYGFQFFLTNNVHSSLLEQFVGTQYVGFIFAFAAILGLVAYYYIGPLLRYFGNHRLVVFLATTQVFALLGLSVAPALWLVVPLYALVALNSLLMVYCMDIFLESYAEGEDDTGSVRGLFLTVMTIAAVLSPLLLALILGDGEAYGRVYFLASLFLIPFTFILGYATQNFRDPEYRPLHLCETLGTLWGNHNLRRILCAQFLLRLFFSWSVIYTPLLLVQQLGFTWEDFGVILAIALTAYVIFEYPTGWIADNILGEKELLLTGIGLIATTLMIIPYFTAMPLLAWAALFFINRIGASFVEVTTESYFFKLVNGTDTNLISVFRMLRPLAFLVGSVSASVALFFVSLPVLFLLFGVSMLVGLLIVLPLQDTR
ncbi:hypothetical protein GVX82_00515 [Patescibacteria group bacterium]|jgi:MFS family permease|nr:hypothetical protein [Patescibacteria group bacterium]